MLEQLKEVLTSGLLKAGDTVTLTKDVKTHYDGLDLKQTTDMLKSELKTDYSTASRVLHKLFYGKKQKCSFIYFSNYKSSKSW